MKEKQNGNFTKVLLNYKFSLFTRSLRSSLTAKSSVVSQFIVVFSPDSVYVPAVCVLRECVPAKNKRCVTSSLLLSRCWNKEQGSILLCLTPSLDHISYWVNPFDNKSSVTSASCLNSKISSSPALEVKRSALLESVWHESTVLHLLVSIFRRLFELPIALYFYFFFFCDSAWVEG